MRSMYTYIEQAPAIAREIIARRETLVGPLVEQFCGMAPKRLLIVASGSPSEDMKCALPIRRIAVSPKNARASRSFRGRDRSFRTAFCSMVLMSVRAALKSERLRV